MKKQGRLLISFIVLVVLAGVYAYAKKIPAKTEVNNDTAVIEILKVSKDNIIEINIQSAAIKFTISKEGTQWKVVGNSIAVDQTLAENLIRSLSVITAERLIVESGADLQQYGLKEPSRTITITLDNGVKQTVELGDKAPGGNSYYLKMRDNSKVYTVSTIFADDTDVTPEKLKAVSDLTQQGQTNTIK